MVVPTFVTQALQNDPITVYGNGRQRRCLNHVKDTVRALVGIAEEPKAIGQIFNIGSTNEIAINDLAKLVKKMTRSNSPIKKIPYNKAYEDGFEDMLRRVPDISKIGKLIGYKPSFTIQDILEDVITFVRDEDRL